MPNGWEEKIEKAICPVCNKPNKRQFRTCSKECTKKFWKTEGVYWSFKLKDKCLERDDYTCVKCGANNKKRFEWSDRELEWQKDNKFSWQQLTERNYKERYEEATRDMEPELVYLEVDHKIPIALGGDEYDLNNLQTLCERCHRKKTGREAKQFALARKGRKTLIQSIAEGEQKTLA